MQLVELVVALEDANRLGLVVNLADSDRILGNSIENFAAGDGDLKGVVSCAPFIHF